MHIELDDAIMRKLGVDRDKARELLAIALYKHTGCHGNILLYIVRQFLED